MHYHIVRPEPDVNIELRIGHLLAVDIEERNLVRRKFGGNGALAVGGKDHMRDDISHRHGVDEFHIGALDRQHGDGLVLAIGDQREVAGWIDAQPRRLLADTDAAYVFRRVRFEIDDMNLVVRYLLEGVPFLDEVDRIGNQRDRAGRVDVEVDGRPDHRILQREIGDYLRV